MLPSNAQKSEPKSIVTVNLDVRILTTVRYSITNSKNCEPHVVYDKIMTRNFAHAGIQISNRAHIYIHYDYLRANNNTSIL